MLNLRLYFLHAFEFYNSAEVKTDPNIKNRWDRGQKAFGIIDLGSAPNRGSWLMTRAWRAARALRHSLRHPHTKVILSKEKSVVKTLGRALRCVYRSPNITVDGDSLIIFKIYLMSILIPLIMTLPRRNICQKSHERVYEHKK